MANPTMIFHTPAPVEAEPRAGRATRVARMIEAFEELGYDVLTVSGYSGDRRRAMRTVQAAVRDGREIRFVYSEATTAPTPMTDPHHLPLRPLLDWRFLRRLRREGTPVGLFYPDVYWRFPMYRESVGPVKRWAATAAYRFDLRSYRDSIDALFVPSSAMARYIPGWESSSRVQPLPPGGVDRAFDWEVSDGSPLQLFYVGSVYPPLYDIAPLVRSVVDSRSATLTICCPADQRQQLPPEASHERISVVHESGEAVAERYARCDVACLVFGDHEYRSFAMPIKLFEALGAGRPVLASRGTAVADYVEEHDVGWTVDPRELPGLLDRLCDDPSEIERRREAVLADLPRLGWSERARTVERVLLGSTE